MLLNRVILIFIIIVTGIFASNYGGNVSYALFYISLTAPLFAFAYTFYVYIRFRLYQEIGQRVVVKGDLTPYSFTLANEDYITFCSIKVNFLQDKSNIINGEAFQDYCLLPNESETMETKLRCNYRGEYYIGADSVDIMDFLYLFKITYPIKSKLKVTVLPRVVPISRLTLAPARKDVKNTPYLLQSVKDTMDLDTRKYQRGDSKKQIHWKVTAKKRELMSRNFITDPKLEMVVIMDLGQIKADELTKIVMEDKIIESALAISNYCKENHTKVDIYYDQNGLNKSVIGGGVDFELFYKQCISLRFYAERPLCNILDDVADDNVYERFYIIITHEITGELYQSCLKTAGKGNLLSILFVQDKLSSEEEAILISFKLAGIPVRRITREDEIGEVLNG